MPEMATKADMARLEATIKRQTLQITIRLGGLITLATVAVAVLVR